MTDNEEQNFELAGDDVVVPFAVEPLDIRGRAVQLGPMLDQILKRHEYPEDVAFMLAEMIVLSVLLGTSLKFDGNFILQTQTNGPVSLVIVDFTTPDAVRAYARFDKAQVAAFVKEGKSSPQDLLGNGVMGMTIDQGEHMQRYQGIVPLEGESLEAAAHQYFKQSEQIPTLVKLSVAQSLSRTGDGETKMQWRAGGVLTQFLPHSEERIKQQDLPSGRDDEDMAFDEDDAWLEASALVGTVSDDELTDPRLGVEQLLYRLFNEHGVRVFDGTDVLDKCSCSREKVLAMVQSFGDEMEDDNAQEEDFVTTCEFCSTVYTIKVDEI